MIAIDTNILLRYLLDDDEQQSPKARQLITGDVEVLVTDVVLSETIWVLTGKRHNLPRKSVIDVIHALFAERNIKFEDSQAVWRALKDFINATPKKIKGKRKQADFPDTLILNKALRYGELNNIKISQLFTFDRAAQEIDGVIEPQ